MFNNSNVRDGSKSNKTGVMPMSLARRAMLMQGSAASCSAGTRRQTHSKLTGNILEQQGQQGQQPVRAAARTAAIVAIEDGNDSSNIGTSLGDFQAQRQSPEKDMDTTLVSCDGGHAPLDSFEDWYEVEFQPEIGLAGQYIF